MLSIQFWWDLFRALFHLVGNFTFPAKSVAGAVEGKTLWNALCLWMRVHPNLLSCAGARKQWDRSLQKAFETCARQPMNESCDISYVSSSCVHPNPLLCRGARKQWVAMTSMLLKMIGPFCKRALEKRRYSARESCNLKEPTNEIEVGAKVLKPARGNLWI